jgi:hypothetical protein
MAAYQLPESAISYIDTVERIAILGTAEDS